MFSSLTIAALTAVLNYTLKLHTKIVNQFAFALSFVYIIFVYDHFFMSERGTPIGANGRQWAPMGANERKSRGPYRCLVVRRSVSFKEVSQLSGGQSVVRRSVSCKVSQL